MKLTDESVAKALGWTPCTDPPGAWNKPCDRMKRPGQAHCEDFPAFTTSLDAITAEIEARGLYWSRHSGEDGAFVTQGPFGPEGHGTGKTSAEALCAALLSYLKESKNA